jgi:hypothetical protein
MAIICRKSVCRSALGMTLRLRPALNDGGYDLSAALLPDIKR